MSINPNTWAVGAALLAGSVRAVQLWRASARVDVINSVVLTTLAEDRGRALSGVLRKSGSGLYLEIARRICEPIDKLAEGTDTDVQQRLDRDARAALSRATRRLQRLAWLDHIALLGILFTGIGAVTGEAPSTVLAVQLVAATLLWLSNMYGARTLVTSLFSGATALTDGLVKGREHFAAALAKPQLSDVPVEPTR